MVLCGHVGEALGLGGDAPEERAPGGARALLRCAALAAAGRQLGAGEGSAVRYGPESRARSAGGHAAPLVAAARGAAARPGVLLVVAEGPGEAAELAELAGACGWAVDAAASSGLAELWARGGGGGAGDGVPLLLTLLPDADAVGER